MEINKSQFLLLFSLAAVIHLGTMQFVYTKGTTFYECDKKTEDGIKCECDEIWDIIHSNFNEYSEYNYTKNWYMIVFLLPLIYNIQRINNDFIKEFTLKFLVIVLLRSLTIMTTILPKNTNVQAQADENGKLSLFNQTVGGACYDKMFSGHFAFGLLLTLLMFKYGILATTTLNIFVFVFINAIHLFILGVTRSHFTMDMVVSLYVTLFVYNLNIKLV